MKASKIIERLERLIDTYGDCKVVEWKDYENIEEISPYISAKKPDDSCFIMRY